MSALINASPKTVKRGVNDQSTRARTAVPEDRPTHLPITYIYAQKGPLTPQVVSGNSRNIMYGDSTFDERSKWFNHATQMNNIINSQGNSQLHVRIKPDDANPEASIRLWLDVLETMVPLYQRNPDGSYVRDADGLLVPVTGNPTVAGIKAKWVVTAVPLDEDGVPEFGLGTMTNGDQVDPTTSLQSKMYPIMDLRVPDFGAYGNNTGLRIWAPTLLGLTPVDGRIIENEKVYPFRIACVARADELSTPTITETVSGEQYLELAFKPDTVDRNTDTMMYVGDRFIQDYQNLEDPSNPPQWGPFGAMFMYNSYMETILSLAVSKELPVKQPTCDLTGEDGEEYRFNLVSATDSSAVPYVTFLLQTSGGNAVRLSENSTIYASGGSDGTMNNAAFAASVSTAVSEFADLNSDMMDEARFPCSIIYDSGFPLATKYDLLKIIAIRKDTFCALAVHDVDGVALTPAQESSLALALRTRAQTYPESEYYGTGVMRAMIVGRSGKLIGSRTAKRYPLTMEVAKKAAAYMGASNSVWKNGFAFDVQPLNQVDLFTDLNILFTPESVRNKDWDNGLVWVQSSSRRTQFFPAFKTVYDNDTSILTSFFTAMCCVELQKVAQMSWVQFTGRSGLTDAQFAEGVDDWITADVQGRFDNRFTIEPRTYYTAADVANGFSWTTEIDLYGPNMKTVATLSINARRLSDLSTQSA